MLTLLASLVTLMAIIVSISGKTWDDAQVGVRKLTSTGRWVLVVAMASFFVSVVQDVQENAKAKAQTNQARLIQHLAHEEIGEAVQLLLFPFAELYQNAHQHAWNYHFYSDAMVDSTMASSVVTFLMSFSQRRFYTEPAYTEEVFLSEAASWVFEEYGHTAGPVLSSGHGSWCNMFEAGSDTCAVLLDRTVVRFGSYLSPETVEAIQDLTRNQLFIGLRTPRRTIDDGCDLWTTMGFTPQYDELPK